MPLICTFLVSLAVNCVRGNNASFFIIYSFTFINLCNSNLNHNRKQAKENHKEIFLYFIIIYYFINFNDVTRTKEKKDSVKFPIAFFRALFVIKSLNAINKTR